MLIIPKLKYNYIYLENNFSGRAEKAYTGTIIKRCGTQSNGIMYHYCFLLGVSEKNEILIIHNDFKGVEILTFTDWLENWGDMWQVEYINKSDTDIENILSRATERSSRHFHLKLNNCEHFVNYCVFNLQNIESQQTLIFELLKDILFLGFDLKIESGNAEEQTKKRYYQFKQKITKPPRIRKLI
jgi:hypothetical protein